MADLNPPSSGIPDSSPEGSAPGPAPSFPGDGTSPDHQLGRWGQPQQEQLQPGHQQWGQPAAQPQHTQPQQPQPQYQPQDPTQWGQPQQQDPGQPGAFPNAPMPPAADSGEIEKPQSIMDMGRFWFAAWAVQAILQGLSAVELATNPAFRDEMIKLVGENNAEMYRQGLTTGTIALGGVIGVVIVITLAFVLARGAIRGRTAPRILLSIGAAYLAFSTITNIFLPADPGSTWFIWASGVLSIISGVCAVLGLWFSFTKESAEYYVQVKAAKNRR